MIAAAAALLGACLVVFLRSAGIFGNGGIRPRLIAATALWLVAGGACWLALHQQGFDAARAGFFTIGWAQLGYGFLFGLLALVSFPLYVLITSKLGGEPPQTDTLATIASASLPQRLFLLCTAAGAEELIFRAVAIGGLMAAGVNHAAAVAVPLVVFVLLHRASWGLAHLAFVTIVGMLMTAAFLYGGLWAAILAHFIVDAPLMLAGKALSARGNGNQAVETGRE